MPASLFLRPQIESCKLARKRGRHIGSINWGFCCWCRGLNGGQASVLLFEQGHLSNSFSRKLALEITRLMVTLRDPPRR